MRERGLDVLRALVACVGTLAPSVLAGAVLARALPFAEDLRIAIGFAVTIPLWVAAMSLAFLDAKVWRAGAVIALASASLAVCVA